MVRGKEVVRSEGKLTLRSYVGKSVACSRGKMKAGWASTQQAGTECFEVRTQR